MVKRLIISFAIIGAMLSVMAFSAFAYMKDSAAGPVTITAGTPDVQVAFSSDCVNPNPPGFLDSFSITQTHIVPGDSSANCAIIKNNGDGTLKVYAHTSGFGGSAGLQAVYQAQIDGQCAYASPNAGTYTTDNGGRGCLIVASLAPGQTAVVVLRTQFVDDHTDQTALAGQTYTFTLSIDGYTS